MINDLMIWVSMFCEGVFGCWFNVRQWKNVSNWLIIICIINCCVFFNVQKFGSLMVMLFLLSMLVGMVLLIIIWVWFRFLWVSLCSRLYLQLCMLGLLLRKVIMEQLLFSQDIGLWCKLRKVFESMCMVLLDIFSIFSVVLCVVFSVVLLLRQIEVDKGCCVIVFSVLLWWVNIVCVIVVVVLVWWVFVFFVVVWCRVVLVSSRLVKLLVIIRLWLLVCLLSSCMCICGLLWQCVVSLFCVLQVSVKCVQFGFVVSIWLIILVFFGLLFECVIDISSLWFGGSMLWCEVSSVFVGIVRQGMFRVVCSIGVRYLLMYIELFELVNMMCVGCEVSSVCIRVRFLLVVRCVVVFCQVCGCCRILCSVLVQL